MWRTCGAFRVDRNGSIGFKAIRLKISLHAHRRYRGKVAGVWWRWDEYIIYDKEANKETELKRGASTSMLGDFHRTG